MPEKRHVLIVGGTSLIAEHVARHLASGGDALYLTGRNAARLEAIAADLRVRGARKVATELLDVMDGEALVGLPARAADALGDLDHVLVAHGELPDQERCVADQASLRHGFEVNAISAMAVAAEAAGLFRSRGRGRIAVIGSVAGDRGRASNYCYGSAKAALHTFLAGLRQDLHGSGVTVLTVKPGFVDTPMTADRAKGLLWAGPDRVARDIVRAWQRDRGVLYTPWFWRWILAVIRAIPERVFVRLKL